MRERMAKMVALSSGLLLVVLALVFGWQQRLRMERLGERLDPLEWQALYPLHVSAYLRGAESDAEEPFDRLADNPFRRRAWAGNAFALEYNAARAHYYAQVDQQRSRRTLERDQPAGCINCHAAEAPRLIETYGWEGLHAMDYDELREQLHHGSSCLDCHDPQSMELRITRPALRAALAENGIDVDRVGRQDMRSYVCAQCHVEYYFRGPGQQLTLPWGNGLRFEDIETYYEQRSFADWTHAETGAGLVKVQHPNFELHNLGVHAARDIACADCHMPQIREEGIQISDHWVRSPMAQIEQACMNCHRGTTERLVQRTAALQQRTRGLLNSTEEALSDLMDALLVATEAGAADAVLADARRAHRRAQMRWDFIDADASRGFHAGEEAARLLTEAERLARAGERSL